VTLVGAGRPVDAGRLVVAYNHPDEDDEIAALIVTLWRRT
jgi:hypothetical protein